MSERYTRLFSLPGSLYTPKAPLLIMAGALLKDNVTGQVLAQVKYKNLGAKPIKALTVSLQALDTRGLPLGQPVEHQYLDLSAPRDSEFGQKEPIPFPDANTRGFSAQVRQVIFSDNSIWEAEGQPWESLPEQQTLEQALGDTELCKEYRSRFPGAAFFPREDGPLWRCTCGAWNEEGENTCHLCGKEKAALFSLDLGALKTSRDRRLAQEAQQKEEKQAAEAKKAKKRKKAGLIALGALVLVCAGAAAVILPQKIAQRKAGKAWVLTQETTVDYEGKKPPSPTPMMEKAGQRRSTSATARRTPLLTTKRETRPAFTERGTKEAFSRPTTTMMQRATRSRKPRWTMRETTSTSPGNMTVQTAASGKRALSTIWRKNTKPPSPMTERAVWWKNGSWNGIWRTGTSTLL